MIRSPIRRPARSAGPPDNRFKNFKQFFEFLVALIDLGKMSLLYVESCEQNTFNHKSFI